MHADVAAEVACMLRATQKDYSTEEKKESSALKKSAHLNSAAAHIKLGEFKDTITAANKARPLSPSLTPSALPRLQHQHSRPLSLGVQFFMIQFMNTIVQLIVVCWPDTPHDVMAAGMGGRASPLLRPAAADAGS
jgi:hypothetical protein